jgi:hypothetical protein
MQTFERDNLPFLHFVSLLKYNLASFACSARVSSNA